MPVFGVICEYDPFHLGHRWMLEQLHRQGPVVCAMSGCFTQRGEFAAVNKFARAEMAVRNGADLVLELPTPWAVSGAERFARGGVELLKKTGLVTHLAFGSECGDLEALQRVEACLSGESFQETLRRRLEGGETFARCRQAAVEELLDPRDAALLSQPNNILAIEYLKALRRADFSMEPITFPRRGGPHDGGAADGIASASHIRRLLRAGHTEEAMAFLPRESAEVLRREIAAGRGPVDMHTCQRAILARLRTMSQEDFLPYDGGGEGLYRRFYRAVRQAADIDGLLEAARTRRYPLARLRRMLLAACLTACSAKPVSLRGTEAPNLPGPTNDALKVTDEGQDWNITLEQVDKENFAEDDRLLAKGSYQVFQLNQEGSGDTLTATAAAAEGINAYFEQWRKDQLQFLGDVTNLARDAYAGVNGEDSRWEQPEYVYSDTVTTDYWVGPKLLCVEMHYSSYSGGAHPNSWRVAVNFDLNTGEAVKLMELAEDSEGLRAAVKENLLYQIRESDIWAEYGAEAFFEDYEDTVGNWADQCLVFDDNGLTVVFNPYTIAPYATGELSYLIPYSLMQPYLNGRAMQLLGLN